MNHWSRVSAVIVTRNSAAVIGNCLKNISAVERVVLVDNASDDPTLSIVRQMRPDAEIICNHIGLGFGCASNQGLERVETEFALHLNPDATICPGAVETMVKTADDYPEAGLVAPRVFNPEGQINKTYNFARHQRLGMTKKRHAETTPDGLCCTWFLEASVLLHRMSALREVGYFDPAFYLFFEDDDLCARYIESGYTLLYVPEAVAIHVGGGSVRAGWKLKWERAYHFEWSRSYYEAKYNGHAAGTLVAREQIRKFLGPLRRRILAGDFESARYILAGMSGGLAYLLRIPVSKTTRRARPD